jgi:hypothetical protein
LGFWYHCAGMKTTLTLIIINSKTRILLHYERQWL